LAGALANPATLLINAAPTTAAPYSRPHGLHADLRQGKAQDAFWVERLGHHADIGWYSPARFRRLHLDRRRKAHIYNFKLVDRGKFREAASTTLLTKAIRRAHPRA